MDDLKKASGSLW